jgi:hypothetical protein
MGLLTGYQDDADRLARQDKNLARTYNHDLRGIKAEAQPLESTVKDYNKQVEDFRGSAVSKKNDSQPGGVELWQVIGWVSANPGYPTVVAHNPNYGGSKWYHGGAGNMYLGSYSSNDGGGWYWQNTDKATIRRASDGTPITSLPHNYGQDWYYASWNNMPFVAPVTQSQIDTAKSADAKLTDLGKQGEAINAEADAARGLLSKKSDRIADDIEMNAGRLREEVAPTQQSGSVFDQNMAGIHQNIADWLHQ